MALTRSRRIFLMAHEGYSANSLDLKLAEEIEVSLIPKYESTKGTSYFERELAIRGWNHRKNIFLIKEKQVGAIEADSTLVPTKSFVNKKQYHDKQNESNSDASSVSEDKTSGSEYLPSDEESYKKVNFFSKMRISDKKMPKSDIHDDINSDLTIPSISADHQVTTQRMQRKYFNKKNRCTISSTQDNKTTNQNGKIRILSNILIQSANASDESFKLTGAKSTSSPAERITDCKSHSIFISAAIKDNEGKRIRNKKHSCYYCHTMILHMAAHLEVKHGLEIDVSRALAFPKNSSKRKTILSELTRAGDFYHNCEVMSLKQGELILVRRPTKTEFHGTTYRDYGPCPNCLGFLLKKNLWHHVKTQCVRQCKGDQSEDAKEGSKLIIAESESMLSNIFGTEFSSDYKKYIINTIRNDQVGEYCKDDALILKFGAMLFEKYGSTQCELIRQNMRQLARLTMTVEKVSSRKWHLVDLLKPQNFDLLVQAVKILCCELQDDSTKRPQFKIPSLALKLGHSLRKCANIEGGVALRQQNLVRNDSLIAFCTIMDLEWQIRVSSNALSTLHTRKINAGELLPITNDLIKCNKYIQAEMQRAQTKLLSIPNSENWYRLAKLILCRIILFNKRRAGEASRMTLEQFTTRPIWSQNSNQEIRNALTPYEIKLAERHTIINIIGKRGRFVPVLLTLECKRGIDILNSRREKIDGINSNNPYIFARSGQAMTALRGPDVIRSIIAEIEELEKPELITGTKLRKYIATVSQVFDLSENECDWLARHLGHDIKVHRNFYRLHEDVVELTKVSRLLMAVDLGKANVFAGKKLDDIQLTELPPIDEEINDEGDDDCFQEDILDIPGASEMGDMSDAITVLEKPKQSVKGSGKVRQSRILWTTDDKKAVWNHFKVKIKLGILPGKVECEECQAKYPSLHSRKWTDIKFCLKNEISKLQKLKKN